MEAIQAYIDNIFRSFPNTKEVLQTKETITTNMFDKYHELKQQGLSENEAIGKVISEFGNIDELIDELGIKPVEQSDKVIMSLEKVKSYLSLTKKTSFLTALGVFLCILSAASVCLFNGLAESNIYRGFPDSDGDSMLSYLSLFVLICIAVVLFLYSGFLTKEYNFIQNGIELDYSTKQFLHTMQKENQASYTLSTIVGVVLCILSPVAYFITEQFINNDSSLPTVPMLLIVAFAVFLFVLFGGRNQPYKKLLSEASKTKEQRKIEKLQGIICGIIMLIATSIFLIFGLGYGRWESAAIIYAISGILCGICCMILSMFTKDATLN